MIPVGISSRKKLTKGQIRKLNNAGLKWNGYEYYGIVDKRASKRLKNYCDRNGIRFKVRNDFGERRPDYRSTFFKNNKPAFGDKYICAYCGRLLKREKVTVDHLYPVGKVNESMRLQKKLQRKNILNVNDRQNLVSSCEDCNKKKGKKLGGWIIRGKIGRYKWLWVLRYIMRTAVFCVAIIIIYLVATGQIAI